MSRPASTLRSLPCCRVLRRGVELAAAGPTGDASLIDRAGRAFPVAITSHLANLIADDPAGPLGRQFMPAAAELTPDPADQADPIGDDARSPLKGLVHRYPDRVLLKPILACPAYCRFCFRREHVGQEGRLTEAELAAALAYIRARPEIWEVILTGGEPLLLGADRLAALVRDLAAIPHLEVIRLHTRLPVTDPERVTPALVAALDTEKAMFVAVHVNHPDELTPATRAALKFFLKVGIPVLAQTVLLKGVNNDEATLARLMRALVACRVKPYYLHHPDLAPGTAHFRPSLAEGRRLATALRGRLSGLCQPVYVLDIPGGHGKTPAEAETVRDNGDGTFTATDWQGWVHRYPPGTEG